MSTSRCFWSKKYVQLKRSVHPTPENHLKMIIVDEQFSLVGPVNLDSFSWSGGYRSYAVWIESKNLAKEKARDFKTIWSHDYLVVSHKVWLGLEAPTSDLQSFLYQEYEKYAPHFKKPCSPECLESSPQVCYYLLKALDFCKTKLKLQKWSRQISVT